MGSRQLNINKPLGAFQVAQTVKNLLAHNVGDPGLILGSGRFPWKREWLPTPVFLSGEFHGHRSLAGYNPWGHKESDMTEQLSIHNYHKIKFTCLNYLF